MIPSQTNLTVVVVKTANSFTMQTYLQSFPQEFVRTGLYSLLYAYIRFVFNEIRRSVADDVYYNNITRAENIDECKQKFAKYALKISKHAKTRDMK